ncbi:IPT/TIG domain-containing protein [Kitasatospora aureofaciens]|uniref:IPT/TIG domain-containing protein n=1 Tax=Kitasatospora aureofaciens TaxID=1894 RepID=UPI0005249AC3|nr:IPT/TIG domain-containing protein [Kitasatospora aureofaciens]
MAPVITSISPTSGHSGQTMTITGTGLGSLSTTKVNIGTKTVTPTTASNTSVTFPIPSGCNGQANVTATVSGVNSNSSAFFYVAAPTVTSLTPSTGPAAPGAIDVFGTGFATATSVAFDAIGTAVPTVLSDSHLSVTPPAHGAFTGCTDAADVIVSSSGGTSSPIGAAGQFTYYALPTVTSVTPNTGPAGTTGVIVSGTCFVDVSSVTFTPVGGGASTPAVNVSAIGVGSLTLDVPGTLAAGTYDIQVTNPGGTSAAVAADHFVVV